MMAVRIDQAPQFPAVLFSDWINFRCSSFQCTQKYCIRICDREDQAHGTPAKRLWAEATVFWRFVAYPKLAAVHRKTGHHAASGIFQAIDLGSAKGRLVEFDSFGTISDGKLWSNRAGGRTFPRFVWHLVNTSRITRGTNCPYCA